MALNAYLHPRNPYRTPPDFKVLAKEEPDFRKVARTELSGKVTINFKDRDAVRVLTTVLLKRDFGLQVEIPPGTLVPTLPLRLNYLLWIQDLLEENVMGGADVVGLDVGVGAACIYPILGAKHLGWRMMGTELDEDNLRCARSNVEKNDLSGRIELHRAEAGDVFGILGETRRRVAFTMCNPPFFDEDKNKGGEGEQGGDQGEDDSDGSGQVSGGNPDSRPPRYPVPPGKRPETRTRGGEVAFVTQMVEESARHRGAAAIFTCLLGHKSSLAAIKRLILGMGGRQGGGEEQEDSGRGPTFVTTEFCQGRTLRWGIAWTFAANIHLPELSQLKKMAEEKKERKPVQFCLDLPSPPANMGELLSAINTWLEEADFAVTATKVDENRLAFTAKTYHQHWKNVRRRRREKMRREREKQAQEEEQRGEEEPTSKRPRLEEKEEEAMETDQDGQQSKVGAAQVELCCRVVVQKVEEAKFSVDMVVQYGSAGRVGAQELGVYLRSKGQRYGMST